MGAILGWPWKIIGSFIGVIAFLGGLWYVWFNPEVLNGTAKTYKTNMERLQRDTTYLHGVILKKDSIIRDQKKLITWFKTEADSLDLYGQEWKNRYNQKKSASDKLVELMTYTKKRLAYYQQLVLNGTYTPTPGVNFDTLSFDNPNVVDAGLKTAYNEENARKSLDSLNESFSRVKASRKRLGNGLKTVVAELSTEERTIRSRTGMRIKWALNRRLRNAEKEAADSMKKIRQKAEEVITKDTTLNALQWEQ